MFNPTSIWVSLQYINQICSKLQDDLIQVFLIQSNTSGITKDVFVQQIGPGVDSNLRRFIFEASRCTEDYLKLKPYDNYKKIGSKDDIYS